MLDLLLGAVVEPRSRPAEFQSPVTRKLHGLLAGPEAAAIPLHKLADAAGCQRDYLNRMLTSSKTG